MVFQPKTQNGILKKVVGQAYSEQQTVNSEQPGRRTESFVWEGESRKRNAGYAD